MFLHYRVGIICLAAAIGLLSLTPNDLSDVTKEKMKDYIGYFEEAIALMKKECRLKRLSLLLVIFFVSFIFCCCSDQEFNSRDPELDQGDQTRIRNVLNGGDIVQDGTHAYFTLQDVDARPRISYLYQVNLTTLEQSELAKLNYSDIDNLNVDQDWIYYVAAAGDEKVNICRINKSEGKEEELMSGRSLYHLIEYRGRLYFEGTGILDNEETKDGLYSMDKGGKDLKCLVEGRVYGIYPRDEELYYIDSNHCVSKVNLNSGRIELVTDEIVSDLIFFRESLYVFSGDRVSLITDSGQNSTFLPENISVMPETVCVLNNDFYFVNLSNPRGVVHYDGAEGDWKRVARLPVREAFGNYESTEGNQSPDAPDRLYIIGGALYMNQIKDGRYGPFELLN